ncbi:hypothetical protein F5Y09DRAFT_126012 [Xylaria sp. FL1042]|nr:hypothetical protein F5Y09DRAFT_126012 [Xylaria sp. FL1042]
MLRGWRMVDGRIHSSNKVLRGNVLYSTYYVDRYSYVLCGLLWCVSPNMVAMVSSSILPILAHPSHDTRHAFFVSSERYQDVTVAVAVNLYQYPLCVNMHIVISADQISRIIRENQERTRRKPGEERRGEEKSAGS